MDFQVVAYAVYEFARDARLLVILALIVADVALAVAQALHERKFDLAKLGEFYQTMVLPYVIGYVVFYVLVGLSAGFESLFGQGVVTTMFGFIALKLASSILSHAKAIGLPLVVREDKVDPVGSDETTHWRLP